MDCPRCQKQTMTKVVNTFKPQVIDAACAGTEDAYLEVNTVIVKECYSCKTQWHDSLRQDFTVKKEEVSG